MTLTVKGPQISEQTSLIKIGEGKYREVFRTGDYALKLLKPKTTRSLGFLKVTIPISLFTKFKFGINDFNQYEYEQYLDFMERVPEEFKNFFTHIYGVGVYNGRSASLSDLVLDDDGRLSKSLRGYGQIADNEFWEGIDKIENVLIDCNIPLLDFNGGNIIVRNRGEKTEPVLIDYKRYGARTCPTQLLFSKRTIMNKLRRRFQRLREHYQAK